MACGRSESNPQLAKPATVAVPRDTQISEDAKRSLDGKGLRDVQIQTENGEVTLSGVVESPDEKTLAEESVKTVPGVVKVKNNISVVEERMHERNINTNKPGGPRKAAAVKTTRPGGPRKDSSSPF